MKKKLKPINGGWFKCECGEIFRIGQKTEFNSNGKLYNLIRSDGL